MVRFRYPGFLRVSGKIRISFLLVTPVTPYATDATRTRAHVRLWEGAGNDIYRQLFQMCLISFMAEGPALPFNLWHMYNTPMRAQIRDGPTAHRSATVC